MKNSIENWIESCEIDREIRRGEYDTLFMEDVTEEEVAAIFKPFVNNEELSKRMNRYLTDYRNDGIKDNFEDKKSFMENLLKLDFEERKPDVEKEVSFFEDVIFPTKYKFNPNYEEVDNQMMGDKFSQDFSDYFRRKKIDEKAKTYALYRAIDRISVHYSYTLYLFQPLVKMNYTANHIYEFLMRGGTYAVIGDTVYYSFE